MGHYLIKRIAIAFPVLLFVTLIAFVLVNLAPGDPVTSMINPATRAELGPEWVKERQAALGLDKPIVVRYGIWLKELVQGNLGYSMVGGQSVSSQVIARIGPTLLIMSAAIFLGTMIGIPLGIFSALRPNSLLDYGLTVLGFLRFPLRRSFSVSHSCTSLPFISNGSRPRECGRWASRIRSPICSST